MDETSTDEPDDLTTLPPRQSEWNRIAVIGGPGEDDLDLCLGYLEAAAIVASHWIRSGTNDALPVPIYYNYRHAIELALKWNIRLAASCLRRDGISIPGLAPDELDRFLGATHSVAHLADRLNQYLGRLQIPPPNNHIDQKTQDSLDWLHQLDEKGQTFRYSTVKGGKGKGLALARPNQQRIDFDAEIRRLHQTAWMLFSGYSSFLDAHAEAQAEYYSEFQHESY
ncbi:hypothetical protein OG763_14685 [Streptomyces sp. NBC_01230]|uniref:hypothetical protein n=1 Tax=Streptomyces sp. NBC_01230 TaxID=2903784 RepID=UPI002E1328EB|nr:hypothetical protein OG763_14685 [Streptomyces sp. NBC_01230]